MRLLVSLSSYGSNRTFIKKVVDVFKAYNKYEVDIIVHCTVSTGIPGVKEFLHDNPPTTSLFHRQDFIQQKDNYDLFLFAEHDMVIKEESIDVYLKHDAQLPINYVLGFIRYETVPESVDYLIDLWLNIPNYSYLKATNVEINDNKYFVLDNVHQACYMLTKSKLNYVITNTQYDYRELDGLGVESASSTLFTGWPLGPRGILNKVLPLDRDDLEKCFIHHSQNNHCNFPGVNSAPEVFRTNVLTKQMLFEDLKI